MLDTISGIKHSRIIPGSGNTVLSYVFYRIMQIFSGLLLSIFFLAILGGCGATERKFSDKWLDDITPFADMGQNTGNKARISCFLTLRDSEAPAVIMNITDIEVFDGNLWLKLKHTPLKINSASIGTGQLFLGSIAAPPGFYQRLRFSINKVEALRSEGKYEVITPEPFEAEINFTSDLSLESGDSKSLLVTWDVQKSLESGNIFKPVMTATPPLKQMLTDLVFAACPDINTIFVIRADKNWVVDSFGLKGRPSYIAIDPDTSRLRLYVLAARDKLVKMVDLSNYRILDFFPAPLNDVPTYMTISPDGLNAFLLDQQSGYLSRMDLASGRIAARVQIGYQPSYAVYLPQQNMLAVSLSLSQKILLLEPESLSVISTIPTGGSPRGITVFEDQLYIAEYGDNTVSVVDLTSRINQDQISVGSGPRRILAADNRIYVSNYLDDSISVMIPGQFGVIQEIYNLGRPMEMVFNEFYQKIYVTDEDAAGLAVIDANSNLLQGHITLGAVPLGLAVIQ